MTSTLAQLQTLCHNLGITIPSVGRSAKEPHVVALRRHFWDSNHPDQPLPAQIEPMLLGDWGDLDHESANLIEQDGSGWCVQEKFDGVRAILHVTPQGVHITGRSISKLTFRLAEFQDNLPHLGTGFDGLDGTILDGELVSPLARIDTGTTVTCDPLHAVTAVLSTTPAKAQAIQAANKAPLRFHAFDILRYAGTDVTTHPLERRLEILMEAFHRSSNPHLDLISVHTRDKGRVHQMLVAEGKEGTVWKKLDEPYQPGRRVRHWLKRKRAISLEVVVSGYKPGSVEHGNAQLVGAVEFSVRDLEGVTKPIGWVSSWTDEERRKMTQVEGSTVALSVNYLGRKALISGQDVAAKSGRLRHAKLIQWLD